MKLCRKTLWENRTILNRLYAPSSLRRESLKTEVSLWKRINWCFPWTKRRRNFKMQQSPVICDLRLRWTRAGNLIDYRGWQFQMPSVWKAFTKSSVFSRGGLVGKAALTVKIKAPLSNFFVVLCGLSHATHRLVVNSDLFEGRDGGSKVLVLYLGARRLGSSLLAPPTLPGLARSKLLWRKWERPLRIFVK